MLATEVERTWSTVQRACRICCVSPGSIPMSWILRSALTIIEELAADRRESAWLGTITLLETALDEPARATLRRVVAVGLPGDVLPSIEWLTLYSAAEAIVGQLTGPPSEGVRLVVRVTPGPRGRNCGRSAAGGHTRHAHRASGHVAVAADGLRHGR